MWLCFKRIEQEANKSELRIKTGWHRKSGQSVCFVKAVFVVVYTIRVKSVFTVIDCWCV